jgi:hypothetical protein
MGFLKDYEEIYEELTGEKLNWRGTFGFAYQRRGRGASDARHALGRWENLKYDDPEHYVKFIRMRCKYLYDPTLQMLMEMYIGDFDEIWEPEPDDEDETPEDSWGDLIDEASQYK